MKYQIISEILKNLNSRPDLKRKLKIFALVGGIGFVITLGLTIWAGVAVYNFTKTKATEVMQYGSYQQQIETAKNQVINLPKLQVLRCWTQVQNLMLLQPWVDRTVAAILTELKISCLDARPPACEGVDCRNVKQTTDKNEGDSI